MAQTKADLQKQIAAGTARAAQLQSEINTAKSKNDTVEVASLTGQRAQVLAGVDKFKAQLSTAPTTNPAKSSSPSVFDRVQHAVTEPIKDLAGAADHGFTAAKKIGVGAAEAATVFNPVLPGVGLLVDHDMLKKAANNTAGGLKEAGKTGVKVGEVAWDGLPVGYVANFANTPGNNGLYSRATTKTPQQLALDKLEAAEQKNRAAAVNAQKNNSSSAAEASAARANAETVQAAMAAKKAGATTFHGKPIDQYIAERTKAGISYGNQAAQDIFGGASGGQAPGNNPGGGQTPGSTPGNRTPGGNKSPGNPNDDNPAVVADNIPASSPLAGLLTAEESKMDPRAALAKRMVEKQGYSYSEANAAVNAMSADRVNELLGIGGSASATGSINPLDVEKDALKSGLMKAVGIDETEMKFAKSYLEKIGKLNGVEAGLDAWAKNLTGTALLKAADENGVAVSASLRQQLLKEGGSAAPSFVVSKDGKTATTGLSMVIGEDGLPSYQYSYGSVGKDGKVTGATTVTVDAFKSADGTYIQHHDGLVVRGDEVNAVESSDPNKGAAGKGVDFTGVSEVIGTSGFHMPQNRTTWLASPGGLTAEQAAQKNTAEQTAAAADGKAQAQQVQQFFGGLNSQAVGDDRGNIAGRLDGGDFVNENGKMYSAGNYAEKLLAQDKADPNTLSNEAAAVVKTYEVTRPIYDSHGNLTGYAKDSETAKGAQVYAEYNQEQAAAFAASGMADNLSGNDRTEMFPNATANKETGGTYVSGLRAKMIGSLNASQMTPENLALLQEIDNEMSGNRAADISMANGSVQGSGVLSGSAADAEKDNIGSLPGGVATSSSSDPNNSALASQPAAGSVSERVERSGAY